jgi:hypothetical protein
MAKMGKLDMALKAVELGKSASNLAGAAKDFRAADKGEMGREAGRHAFSTGADAGKEVGKTWLKTFEVIPRLVCRGLQFLFAIIVCGFYGNRVDSERRDDESGYSAEWIFALLVAGLSAVTAVLFVVAAPLSALPVVGSRIKITRTYRAFGWDVILFIAWIVVFGIFAGIFLGRDSDDKYKGASTGAMKTAVWVDLVNVILWLVSAVYGGVKTFLGDKVDSLTDKAGSKLFTKKKAAANKEMEMDGYAQSV